MQKRNTKENIYAFIDTQNLIKGLRRLGFKINFRKFYRYLQDKYKVKKAYLFLGYLPENEDFYIYLRSVGFQLIFKPVVKTYEKAIKGNCDAELVLQAMIDLRNYSKAIIATADGDFYCLVNYLDSKEKLLHLMIPDENYYSSLLRKFISKSVFVNGFIEKIKR